MEYYKFTEDELDEMFTLAMKIVSRIKEHYADDEDYLHQIDEFTVLNTFAYNCYYAMSRKYKMRTQKAPDSHNACALYSGSSGAFGVVECDKRKSGEIPSHTHHQHNRGDGCVGACYAICDKTRKGEAAMTHLAENSIYFGVLLSLCAYGIPPSDSDGGVVLEEI